MESFIISKEQRLLNPNDRPCMDTVVLKQKEARFSRTGSPHDMRNHMITIKLLSL